MAPYITAKYFTIEHQDPYINARFIMPINKIIDNSLVANQLIKFPHNNDLTKGASGRLYQIKKINFNFGNDIAEIEARDITRFEDLRTADKLLIHSNTVDNSQLMRNDAVGCNEPVTIQAAAATHVRHKTAQKKWGTSSIRFPNTGVNDFLSAADNPNWDIITQTNFTIDTWIRRDAISADVGIIEHHEDANNRWNFRITGGDVLRFQVYSGGANIVVLNDDGTNISAVDTWYHVAIIKVGDDYGTYVDGTQVAFVNDNSTDTFTGQLIIGYYTAGTDFLVGFLDEVRLTHDNYFSAVPVVGLTDTITPPAGMYDDFGGTWPP